MPDNPIRNPSPPGRWASQWAGVYVMSEPEKGWQPPPVDAGPSKEAVELLCRLRRLDRNPRSRLFDEEARMLDAYAAARVAEARAQEREQWRGAVQRLIDLYVSNRGTKWEFISCVTPRHASAMTPDERAADKVWSLWDALRALAEPQE